VPDSERELLVGTLSCALKALREGGAEAQVGCEGECHANAARWGGALQVCLSTRSRIAVRFETFHRRCVRSIRSNTRRYIDVTWLTGVPTHAATSCREAASLADWSTRRARGSQGEWADAHRSAARCAAACAATAGCDVWSFTDATHTADADASSAVCELKAAAALSPALRQSTAVSTLVGGADCQRSWLPFPDGLAGLGELPKVPSFPTKLLSWLGLALFGVLSAGLAGLGCCCWAGQ
jgi:hypothetical protein